MNQNRLNDILPGEFLRKLYLNHFHDNEQVTLDIHSPSVARQLPVV